LAVKARYFKHLIDGQDPDAGRVYRWHIEARKTANAKVRIGMDGKSGTDQYVADCRQLLLSMRRLGFLPEHAVPIDLRGELLGGAHRVACALALGIEDTPVIRKNSLVWAPPWGDLWFIDNGCPAEDLSRIRQDFQSLHDSHRCRPPSDRASDRGAIPQG
jgi:hypothetical protein